jgi:hypothetical protein
MVLVLYKLFKTLCAVPISASKGWGRTHGILITAAKNQSLLNLFFFYACIEESIVRRASQIFFVSFSTVYTGLDWSIIIY